MTDYLLDTDFDLRIEGGDFVVGDSDLQHQQLLMGLEKGELRQYPKTGVGLTNYLVDDNIGDLYQEIQRQFENDGLLISKLEVSSEGIVNVVASYR